MTPHDDPTDSADARERQGGDEYRLGFDDGLRRAVSVCFRRIHAIEGKGRVQTQAGKRALAAAAAEVAETAAAIRQEIGQ